MKEVGVKADPCPVGLQISQHFSSQHTNKRTNELNMAQTAKAGTGRRITPLSPAR